MTHLFCNSFVTLSCKRVNASFLKWSYSITTWRPSERVPDNRWNMDKPSFRGTLWRYSHAQHLLGNTSKVESFVEKSASEKLANSCCLVLVPVALNPRPHLFHSRNTLPWVSVPGGLANKTLDNVTLSSCWAVVDCDGSMKRKHSFGLYSNVTTPGTAPQSARCGKCRERESERERRTALWDFFFFFAARNMWAGRYISST